MKDIPEILAEVNDELDAAINAYNPMSSAHEGFAVVLEEVDELWDEVKLKPKLRSKERMKKEAIQIAAMAIRFVYDICED